jgi:adenylate cyclase, class 2
MAKNEEEIEVKFLVRDLHGLARKIEALGGRTSAERVHETNLRFDSADEALSQGGRVLRLRQDANAVLTYKDPPRPGEEVSARREIEFRVSDFDSARHFLEALGYHVAVMYEKYRTTYQLDALTVTLDEMPFGMFVEIEGPDTSSIRSAAAALQLNWETRSTASYMGLFNALRSTRNLTAQNLSFAELSGAAVRPEDLGLHFADG